MQAEWLRVGGTEETEMAEGRLQTLYGWDVGGYREESFLSITRVKHRPGY